MSARTKLLAKVHVAKKQLAMDDETYRSVIYRTVGKRSSGDCNDRQLGTLMKELEKLGFRNPSRWKPASPDAQVRMIHAIWADIRKLLDGEAGDDQLRSFVQRQTRDAWHPDGISAPEFLDAAGAKRVIEGLKGWRARLVAENAAAGLEVVS